MSTEERSTDDVLADANRRALYNRTRLGVYSRDLLARRLVAAAARAEAAEAQVARIRYMLAAYHNGPMTEMAFIQHVRDALVAGPLQPHPLNERCTCRNAVWETMPDCPVHGHSPHPLNEAGTAGHKEWLARGYESDGSGQNYAPSVSEQGAEKP